VEHENVGLDVDDVTISLGLAIGSPSEQQEAFRLAWTKYRNRVASFIYHLAPGLSPDCVATATNDAFRGLYAKAIGGNFDPDKPLVPLLFTIAKARTIDQLRRKFSRRAEFESKFRSDDDFAEEVGRRITGTDVGFQWRLAVSQGRALELKEIFLQFVGTLPSMQRRVAQVIADALPGDLANTDIADVIFLETGSRPTVVQIRSARNQMEMKFRTLLERGENK
jgi:DNA-directed RNA polymerase specialized sigma24 family protein